MGTTIIPKTLQNLVGTSVIERRTVFDSNPYYTCPAGKKARVKARVQCTNTGASAKAWFQAALVNLVEWRQFTISTSSYGASGENNVVGASNATYLMQGTYSNIEFILNAGEYVQTPQDGGFTNAEFNVNMDITELPE